jgi:hypothetical protein
MAIENHRVNLPAVIIVIIFLKTMQRQTGQQKQLK